MSIERDGQFDIKGLFEGDEPFPQPNWTAAETAVGADSELDWTTILRAWLTEFASRLGTRYEVVESENFLILASRRDSIGISALRVAEVSRAQILSVMEDVASYNLPGKHVVIIFRGLNKYYDYVSHYYPDGEFGTSAGVQIREGYPHIAMYGRRFLELEASLAHELTHTALQHLRMPVWLEEGLAQMFEFDIAGRTLLQPNSEMGNRHLQFWREHGLDQFWNGEGFLLPGEIQLLSYQLAEILVRLIVYETRPRWFGLVREPHQKLLAFLRSASIHDHGLAACREHLGCGLDEIAAKFLGPGEWSKRSESEPSVGKTILPRQSRLEYSATDTWRFPWRTNHSPVGQGQPLAQSLAAISSDASSCEKTSGHSTRRLQHATLH